MCFACSPFAGALAGAMSRRALLKHTVAGVAFAGMAGATRGFVCSPAEAATESVDTLYVGGPIVTINDAQPTAEAVGSNVIIACVLDFRGTDGKGYQRIQEDWEASNATPHRGFVATQPNGEGHFASDWPSPEIMAEAALFVRWGLYEHPAVISPIRAT